MNPVHLVFGNEWSYGCRVFAEIDADDFKTLIMQFVIDRCKLRGFRATGSAPGAPEIQKYNLADEFCQSMRIVINVREGKNWSFRTDFQACSIRQVLGERFQFLVPDHSDLPRTHS